MIEKITNSNIYNNKTLLKGLKFVSDNSAVFLAGTSLAMQGIVRPISTVLAPKTPKEDKKISLTKSVSSAITGFLFMLAFSTPFSKAVKNIDKNPLKYISKETIKNIGHPKNSKEYQFITQLFKLGLGFLLAYPKAIVNNKVIPFVNEKFSKKDDNSRPSFKGKLENIISATINNKNMQEFSKKASNTKFTTHLIALGDIFSTFAFTNITKKNKKLDNHQKEILNNNAIISTSLCLLSGYALDFASDRPMKKILQNLEKANKNSADLMKYKQGANILKTSLIFGIIYYGLIPSISTFLSSKLSNKTQASGHIDKNNI